MSTDNQTTKTQPNSAVNQKSQEHHPSRPHRVVVPIGTLVVVGFLVLNIVFFWMLVLGVQQGRA